MSFHFKGHPVRVLAMLPVTMAVMLAFCTLAAAQDQPAPKWEFFGGYSFWYPGADVHGTLPLGLVPLTSRMESNPRGAGLSATYNFNRWFGLTLDGSTHWGSGESTLARTLDDAAFTNLSFGPKVTFRSTHFSPFLEVLVGDHRLMPDAFHDIDKLGVMAGGGLDVNVSRHIALRLFRADYVMSSYQYGPKATTPSTDLSGVRLQAGIVFMLGGDRIEKAATADCTAQPGEVFAGEFVTATATGSNFNPKRTVKYNWSGTGVKAAGSEASTQVDTTGLQPGPYSVTAGLSDGSKHGVANCTARFAVKQPHPPTITCVSNPASVRAGGTSTIRADANSPDGRKLTYSYSADAGNIGGNTAVATLESRDARPGTITVTCNVSDDRSPALTASSTTTLNIQAPPPPPVQPETSAIERRLAIHSIYFATARPRVEHPEAGLLPSQEQTLVTLSGDFKTLLQTKPNARLTLEGHADPRGTVEYNQALSERRVNRTRQFLIEQGVPEASIQTKAFGEQENLTDAQVKDAVEKNPELSPEQRQKVLANMNTVILASNRRVDITLTNAGQSSQESVREYPFNAADSLTLLDTKGGKTARPPARTKKSTKKK